MLKIYALTYVTLNKLSVNMNHLNAFTAINIVEIVKHKNDDTGKTNDSVVIVDDNNSKFEPNAL